MDLLVEKCVSDPGWNLQYFLVVPSSDLVDASQWDFLGPGKIRVLVHVHVHIRNFNTLRAWRHSV